MTNRSGFTLIEVLLVTLMLAFLAVATFVAVRSTIDTKERIDQKTELLQAARASLAILERDIRLAAFNYPEDQLWFPIPPSMTNPQNHIPPVLPKGVSYFNGTTSSILFSSRSHQRMSADSPENEEHFVEYRLDGSDLIRSESRRALSEDDYKDKSRLNQFTLLKNVKRFALEYWDTNKDDWTQDWDTDKAFYQKRLPYAVKITLEYDPDVDVELLGEKKVEAMLLTTIVTIIQSSLKTSILQLGAPSVQQVGGNGAQPGADGGPGQ